MEEDSTPDASIGQKRRITQLVSRMDGDREDGHQCNKLQIHLPEQSNILSLEEKKSPLVISNMKGECAISEISLSVQLSPDSFQKNANWSPGESVTRPQENQEMVKKEEMKEISCGNLVDGVGDGRLKEGAADFGILGDAREEASGKWLNSAADSGIVNVASRKDGDGFVVFGNDREEVSWQLSTFSGDNGVVEVESRKNAAVEEDLVKLMKTNSEKVASVEKTNNGSLTCSLKIEVIDGTAVIDVSKIAAQNSECVNRKNIGKKELDEKNERRTRRRVKSGRKGLGRNGNLSKLRGEGFKIAYTKEEMEALRYANVKGQKKMWQKIYNGFADKLRRDYDDLISCRQHKLGLLSFDPHQTAGRKNNYPGILRFAAAR
ncbi:hypothetical protein Ancab_010540 [Ancistrocladus abbreviatus]